MAEFLKCIALNGVGSDNGSMTLLIKGSKVDLLFCQDNYSQGSSVDPLPNSTESLLTVVTNPASWQIKQLNFDGHTYFAALTTINMGRSLVYAPVMTSTQEVLSGNLPFSLGLTTQAGVVCVAGQQTKGRGMCMHAYHFAESTHVEGPCCVYVYLQVTVHACTI